MTPRLFPSPDVPPEPMPVTLGPNGHRIFQVTDRTIQERTRLVVAKTPEEAVADDAQELSGVSRQQWHEVVACVELLPMGPSYHVPPVST